MVFRKTVRVPADGIFHPTIQKEEATTHESEKRLSKESYGQLIATKVLCRAEDFSRGGDGVSPVVIRVVIDGSLPLTSVDFSTTAMGLSNLYHSNVVRPSFDKVQTCIHEVLINLGFLIEMKHPVMVG